MATLGVFWLVFIAVALAVGGITRSGLAAALLGLAASLGAATFVSRRFAGR